MKDHNNSFLNTLKRSLLFKESYLAEHDNAKEVHQYQKKALIASLLCFLLALVYFGLYMIIMVLAAFISGTVAELIFSRIRKKPNTGGTLIFSLLLVLFLPPSIPLWMVALGSAFGIIFGKEVFGGTGTYIFHPVLISKAFLMFSYPTVVIGTYFGSMLKFDNPDAWIMTSSIILIGGIIILFARKTNFIILLSILISGIALALFMISKHYLVYKSVVDFIVADGFLFGACLLACDPCISPRSKVGKIIYGVIIGCTAVLMRSFSNYSEAMLSAVLFGNLVTPTIDAIANFKKSEEESA